MRLCVGGSVKLEYDRERERSGAESVWTDIKYSCCCCSCRCFTSQCVEEKCSFLYWRIFMNNNDLFDLIWIDYMQNMHFTPIQISEKSTIPIPWWQSHSPLFWLLWQVVTWPWQTKTPSLTTCVLQASGPPGHFACLLPAGSELIGGKRKDTDSACRPIDQLIALSPANHNDYLRIDWKTRQNIHTLYTIF